MLTEVCLFLITKLHLTLGLELFSFFNLDSNPGQYFDQMSFYIYFLCYWAIENVTAGCDSLRGRLQKRREVKMNAGERRHGLQGRYCFSVTELHTLQA